MLRDHSGQIGSSLNNLLNFQRQKAVALVDVVSALAHLAGLTRIPDVACIYFDIVGDTSVPIQDVSLVAGHAYSISSDIHTISTHIHAVGSSFGKAGDAAGAGIFGLGTVDHSLALSVVEDGAESAVCADSIISGVGDEARRAVLEAVAVAVKRVGGLADEALAGGAVEGAPRDGRLINALAGHTEFEALPAGEADIAGGVAVVAVVGATGGQGDKE